MVRYTKRVAMITGASSGMGREMAITLGKECDSFDELWLIARRSEYLTEVMDEINKPCILIPYDISEESFYPLLRQMLKQEKANIRMLVNCAGYGLIGPFEDSVLENTTGMVKTNCYGLTAITHLVLPYMTKGSRIINFSSASAFTPQPDFAVYAATKSYVLSFSRALNQELKKRKISVTAVCPGPVATDFFRIAEDGKARAWYKDYFMSSPQNVVKQALKDAKNRKEISIYGNFMKGLYLVSKLIPHRFLLWAMNMLSKTNKRRKDS